MPEAFAANNSHPVGQVESGCRREFSGASRFNYELQPSAWTEIYPGSHATSLLACQIRNFMVREWKSFP